MMANAKFWVFAVFFQVVFGLSIFFVTRFYYSSSADSIGIYDAVPKLPGLSMPGQAWNSGSASIESVELPSLQSDDPVEISRQADEYFSSKRYDLAAVLYERLLKFDMNRADTYNNLGITLHYVGRSADAIARLNEGIIVDPSHQRLWLTLGFVHSQLGNTSQARVALTNAVELGTEAQVTQSASAMLSELPSL